MGSGAKKTAGTIATGGIGLAPSAAPKALNWLTGKNIGGDNSLPGVTPPDFAGDQAQIGALDKKIRDLYGEQSTAQNAGIDKQMGDMITNLTTGPQGEALRQKYNNLGILNSGAFNQGLAEQFTPIQQNAQNQVLEQGYQQFGDLRNLAGAGTERQFGLEDWMRNAQQEQALAQYGGNVQEDIAKRQSRSDLVGSLIGAGGQIGGGAASPF
jgi:hypothetical protein